MDQRPSHCATDQLSASIMSLVWQLTFSWISRWSVRLSEGKRSLFLYLLIILSGHKAFCWCGFLHAKLHKDDWPHTPAGGAKLLQMSGGTADITKLCTIPTSESPPVFLLGCKKKKNLLKCLWHSSNEGINIYSIWIVSAQRCCFNQKLFFFGSDLGI